MWGTPDEGDEELAHPAHSADESQNAEGGEIGNQGSGSHGAAQHKTVDCERQSPADAANIKMPSIKSKESPQESRLLFYPRTLKHIGAYHKLSQTLTDDFQRRERWRI